MNQQLEGYLQAYHADWIETGPPSPQVLIAMIDEIARLRAAVEAQMQAKHAAEAEARTLFDALQRANARIAALVSAKTV